MAMLPGESIDTAVKRIWRKKLITQINLIQDTTTKKANKRGRGDIFFYCILTTKKEDHDQIPEKREWIESTNDKLKNMLKHETDYNAVLAANAWKAKFGENVSKNNGDPKLFRHGKEKMSLICFYREAADWVEQPSSKTIAPAGDETTDVGEENKAQ
uniref:Transposase n=1 Tax=Ditylenchus dipsaci TaxID=166011 RepID=A0A915EHL6_9BILA